MYRLDEEADEEDSKYSWHDEDLSRWRKVNHWDSPGGGDILESAAWPLACAHWRGLLLGKHPHLWTELFPALLGTVRSVQLSAQGQLMRCENVKLYPLSYKHWSLGQNMRNLAKMTNSAADMIPAGLAAGWWSHLLVWDALKHGTLHVTRRKQFGVVNNYFVYSSHAHEHKGGILQ